MITRYTSSFDETIAYTEICFQVHLTANTVTAITIPGARSEKFILTFGCSSNSSIFMGYNVVPTLPAADTADTQDKVEFVVPGWQRYAIGEDVISFITADTVDYLSVSVRSIPN